VTGTPIRVLIVDDAIVVRRMLSDVIGSDPGCEVIGTASNGRLGVEKVADLNPDVVILDIEMPELDGLGTVTEIRKTNKRVPIIMFSTLTERGASATLDALARGANDYVTKPSNVGSVTIAMQRIREELIPKIKQFTTAAPLRPPASSSLAPPRANGLRPSTPIRPLGSPAAPPLGRSPSTPSPLGATPPRPGLATPSTTRRAPTPSTAAPAPARPAGTLGRRGGPIDAVGIVASTGGPNALAELLPALPASLGVPVLIVQHMPPLFTQMLAKRIDASSALSVREGAAGEKVEAGTVWIAPGGEHLTVKRDGTSVVLGTNLDPPENSCRPAADVLLRAMADVWGGRLLLVFLTGMGADGLRGCEQIAPLGGQVLAQDEETSVVWGIPGNIVKAGLADKVMPLGDLALEISTRVGISARPRPAGSRP
jgi:two-component system chemotaxis response regulator CheB